MLPEVLQQPLTRHLHWVKLLHDQDLARKYPNANREWLWQYVFPAAGRSKDQRDGVMRRFHTSPSTLQRAVRRAGQQAAGPNG